MVRQAPVICVMAPPIHLGAWSMLWLPFVNNIKTNVYAYNLVVLAFLTMRLGTL